MHQGWIRFWEKSYPDTFAKEGFIRGKDPLFYHLYCNSYRDRERAAIIFYGHKISWEELRILIWKAAETLRQLGTVKGDRVYLGMQNCPQFVVSYFAVQLLGAIVVAGSPMFRGGELTYILNDSGAKIAILEESQYTVWSEVCERVPSVAKVIVTSLKHYVPDDAYPSFPSDLLNLDVNVDWANPRLMSWNDFLTVEPLAQIPDVDMDDVALLQYTSGTTGHPKGAMITHDAILHIAAMHTQTRHDTPADVMVIVLPMFHVTCMVPLCSRQYLVVIQCWS